MTGAAAVAVGVVTAAGCGAAIAAGSPQASERRRAPRWTAGPNSGLTTIMDRQAAVRTAAGGAGFEHGTGSAASLEDEIPDIRSATGARGSKVGFHARFQVVATLATGRAGRRFISMEHRTATAGVTAGERGVSGASRRHGAMVDRMTVAARVSPGSRGAHLVPSGANPACERSTGAWRSGAIHSGPIDEPGMRGGSQANGRLPRPIACAGDEFAETVSATKPERRAAGELRLLRPGIADCVGKLRGRALRSIDASKLAAVACSATNSAAGGKGRGAGGGAGSTGEACWTSCV